MNSVSAQLKRHWRLITFIICLVLFAWLLWTFISVILPFIVGLIIAYLLLPIVRWLEKHLPGNKKHLKALRISVIIIVYIAALIILAALAFYIYTVIRSSTSQLWQTLPDLISGVVAWVQHFMASIRLHIPASMLQQYDKTIAGAGVTVINTLRSGLGHGFSIIRSGVGLVLGFMALPLIVFFTLKDWDSLRDGFFKMMPSWASVHARNVAVIFERVLGRYIRGQVILSTFIGVMVLVLLTVLKIQYAPALALWAALMENVPSLGFLLSMVASVSVALATNPGKALWIIGGLIVIQLIENNLLGPRITGKNMKMNPIFIILASLVGASLFGIWGFIIAVPITATCIELLKYFFRIGQQKESA
jgi:predicted PurR-regulated permease PerM